MLALALLLVILGTTPRLVAGQSMIFDDEFNGTTLGSAWVALNRPGDASNSEAQCYTPQNVAVAGGALAITSAVDSSCASYNYTSGMIQWQSLNFLYGTVQIRARLAGGQGTWPALWLLGANCQQTNISTPDNVGSCAWPAPGSDEIDIAEVLNSNYTVITQQIHSGTNNRGCVASVSDVSQNWHTYTLVWQAGSVTWQIDGSTTCTVTQSVPSTPMFLLVDTALGGTAGGVINNSTLQQTTLVDFVRVNQVAPSPSPSPTATPSPSATPTATPSPTGVALVGDTRLEASADSNTAGVAQAFPYTAGASGSATALNVYVDATNHAASVVIGIYTDATEKPGSLLAQGTIAAPIAGAWNAVRVSAGITAGTKYWLAILGPTGTGVIGFRDVAGSSNPSVASAQSNLATLPSTWSSGPTWGSAPASVYASS